MMVLELSKTLDGGEVLPGFQLALKTTFKETVETHEEQVG